MWYDVYVRMPYLCGCVVHDLGLGEGMFYSIRLVFCLIYGVRQCHVKFTSSHIWVVGKLGIGMQECFAFGHGLSASVIFAPSFA